jgi:sterol desaturase/sphingolipid hydroxylase (fatty acid hydroxylase superfamily)
MLPFLLTVLTHFLAMFYFVPLIFQYKDSESVTEGPDYITNSVPFFFLLAILEYAYGRWRKVPLYTFKDTIMSLSLGTTQQLVGIWMKEISYVPYIFVYRLSAPYRAEVMKTLFGTEKTCYTNASLDSSESDFYRTQLIYFIIGFLGMDVSYYFMHRFAHELHAFWFSHSVHHSGERYNLITALRQGSFQQAYSWLFTLPWAVVGLPPIHYLRHNRLNTVYQFWIHTEVIGRLPWFFEMIFNTPSHHRPHHRPPGNCNYAGVLIIWDRLFGTFVAESDLAQEGRKEGVKEDYKRGIVYGLSKPLITYDPLKANIQHLINLSESGGDKVSFWEKWTSLTVLFFRKRVHHPFMVVTSVKELIPDVCYDLQLEEGLSFLEKLGLYWTRFWRLPPPVPDLKEVPAMKGELSKVQPLNNNSNGSAENKKKEALSGWTMRDLVFLEGREKRDRPILSFGYTLVVAGHFLIALVLSYALMLIHTWPIFQNKSGSSLGKMYLALYTVTCFLLLQTVQFHYFGLSQKESLKSE